MVDRFLAKKKIVDFSLPGVLVNFLSFFTNILFYAYTVDAKRFPTYRNRVQFSVNLIRRQPLKRSWRY